jgi:CTP:molybdopterin cytidylyltransferase MocA
MVAAVILAAGASTRLGEPKQLVKLTGENLLERAVRTAREAGCSPVVVVLGAAYEEILGRSQLGDAITVINTEWAEGMGSSIRLGVQTLHFVAKDAKGAVLMACDQPAVTAAHLRALMASGDVTASAYAGRRGVPAYFLASTFAELVQLRGDQGARELLRDANAIELPNGELDIDTLADVATAERIFK